MDRDMVVVVAGPDPWTSQPLTATEAAEQVASLRAAGEVATMRPLGGGHLDAWRRSNAPVAVGGRLCVRSPWWDEPARAGATVIEIDPGRAFGTGSHPTTALLLEALVDQLVGGERVLDVGCGSGVLAIAAAALGAGEVVGTDIEPEALRVTLLNAERNGVRVAVDPPAGRFDVIVANIGAVPLRELAPSLLALLAPAGWLGLSGLSPAQLSTVAAAYRPLVVAETRRNDDWAAIVMRSCDTIGW